MRTFAAIAALAIGANAAVMERNDKCCFGLSASGGVSGQVGQLDDGQNRVGDGHPPGHYCLSNGGLTDGQGRGCILTPPTTQFQCDVGATPTGGFSINGQGQLEHAGSTHFVACKAIAGEYNIYTNPDKDDVVDCVDITLMTTGATGCTKPKPKTTVVTVTKTVEGCPATTTNAPPPTTTQAPPTTTTQAPPPTTTQAPPPTTTTGATTCPTDLSGNYEYPHLIVPIDSSKPNTAEGTSYFGTVSDTVSSIFNFDIPYSDQGKTCSLVFLFPKQSDLETSSYTFSGDGKIDVSKLKSPATAKTTFNNAPDVAKDFGTFTVAPGNSYRIATFDCPAGQRVGYEISNAGSTDLHYFQDYNPSPIGLYITTC